MPTRVEFFWWFIMALSANVKGRGCSLFSRTAPTIRLLSNMPAMGKNPILLGCPYNPVITLSPQIVYI